MKVTLGKASKRWRSRDLGEEILKEYFLSVSIVQVMGKRRLSYLQMRSYRVVQIVRNPSKFPEEDYFSF